MLGFGVNKLLLTFSTTNLISKLNPHCGKTIQHSTVQHKTRTIHRLGPHATNMNSPSSTPSAMRPSSEFCWLMTLPNELLRESFSYLIPISRWGYIDDNTRRDFFSLRSVCRTFRAVIDGLDFWCDPEFEYVDLIKSFPYAFSQQEREVSQAEFLNVLFRNPILKECIG